MTTIYGRDNLAGIVTMLENAGGLKNGRSVQGSCKFNLPLVAGIPYCLDILWFNCTPQTIAIRACSSGSYIHRFGTSAVVAIESTALLVGKWLPWTLGEWTENTGYVWSIFLATLLGHALAYFANKNLYHTYLNTKFDLTQRTSYPSEWFSAFARHKNYIILHLAGERRVYGWPNEWPDHPDAGYFVLQEPRWLLEDNTEVPIVVDEFMLIPAANVEMVEFLKDIDKLEGQSERIKLSQTVLVELQKKKSSPADNKNDEGNTE